MAKLQKILITGGTGTTGRTLTRLLLNNGFSVRIASRHPDPARFPGAEHVVFDWANPNTHADALKSVDGLYLVAPTSVLEPFSLMAPFVERALLSGVRRIVLLSAAAYAEGVSRMGHVHRLLRETAREWAVLQPSWFMQNFIKGSTLKGIRDDGIISTSTGMGKIGFVDAADIAAVGFSAFQSETAYNSGLVITGPETLSYSDIAAILSNTAGRSVRHVTLDRDDQYLTFVRGGVAPEYARHLVHLDEQIEAGAEDILTPVVENLVGRPANSFAAFASANRGAWVTQ